MENGNHMENKIKIIKDKKDIEIQCTEENIINITGMIGSGKTTKANLYRNDERYIVISLDCLYRGQDKENSNEETRIINQRLKEKFPKQDNEQYFKQYYDEIIRYINNCGKNVIWVLEGQQIYRFLSFKDIKGKLIIKRTGLLKCWKRSIVRHIKKKRLLLKQHQITKKQYYENAWYWIKRRTKQLEYYKDLKRFLDEIPEEKVKEEEK